MSFQNRIKCSITAYPNVTFRKAELKEHIPEFGTRNHLPFPSSSKAEKLQASPIATREMTSLQNMGKSSILECYKIPF
jgi:hypothetical protein